MNFFSNFDAVMAKKCKYKRKECTLATKCMLCGSITCFAIFLIVISVVGGLAPEVFGDDDEGECQLKFGSLELRIQ